MVKYTDEVSNPGIKPVLLQNSAINVCANKPEKEESRVATGVKWGGSTPLPFSYRRPRLTIWVLSQRRSSSPCETAVHGFPAEEATVLLWLSEFKQAVYEWHLSNLTQL
ncbi:hypothetical protein WKK05_23720 [Nostoc sp. UHCC 0302]|uniref:hypothetical protein n=1 Tax=Nostoc sp. UHCC 0302 TaxID=3134896 RepID=UPI00311C8C2A